MDCSHIAVRFLSGSPQLQSSPPTRAVLGLGVFWDPTRARSKEALEALALTSFWPPSLQQSACNPSWSQNLPACQASCHGGGCGGSLLIQADVGRGSRVSSSPSSWLTGLPKSAWSLEAMADAGVIPVDWTTAYLRLAVTFSKVLLWSLQSTFQFGNLYTWISNFFSTLPA